jgi:hypothetical protein
MTQYPASWVVRDLENAEIGHVIALGPIDPGKTDLVCANCGMDPPGKMLGWYLCPNAHVQMFFVRGDKTWSILGRLIMAPCPVCNRFGDGAASGNFQQAPEREEDQEKYTDI